MACPPSGMFHNLQKGLHHWGSTYPASGINLSLVVHQVTTGTLAASSQGLPDTVPRAYVLVY